MSCPQFINVELVDNLTQLLDDAFFANIEVLAIAVLAAGATIVGVPFHLAGRSDELLFLESGHAGAALAAHHHFHEGELTYLPPRLTFLDDLCTHRLEQIL